MKVLFLDVDGVLKCTSRWNGDSLDELCLANLVRIAKATDCKIVVSSTLRLMADTWRPLCKTLKDLGLDVKGKTPRLNKLKHSEIREWMKQYKPEKFAIVDDEVDAGIGFESFFFQTSTSLGLTDEIADKIIECLLKE